MPKLIVVQNELKGQRGHYHETAVAVASAAAEFGYTPYIVGHATCPPDLVPAPLAFLPLCRLDHHCHHPPPSNWALGPFAVWPPADQPPPPAPPASVARRVLRNLLPPVLPKLVRRLRPTPTPAPPDPLLAAANCGHEPWLIREWERDLELVLTLLQVSAGDHLLFLTAHARELHAVRNVLERLPADRQPLFHLEFRHALEFDRSGKPRTHFTAAHVALFDLYRPRGEHPNIRLYTDTPELSAQYASVSGLSHFVLPIPFRHDKLPDRKRTGVGPLVVSYVGDPRDEKGFPELPGLVERSADLQVRFVIQASFADPANNPRTGPAVAALRAVGEPRVTLVGEDGPLPADRYYELVSGADVLVFPFAREAYGQRSSGTLTEAIAAGVPTVVTADTWLAKQQPPGSGETCTDGPSLAAAVRRIATDYDRYAAAAAAGRSTWLARHNPANLVRTLITGEVI